MTEWGRHAFIELSFKETNWFDNVRIWPRPGAERFGTNFFIFVSDLPFTSTSTNVRFDPGVSTYGTEFSGPVGNIGPNHSRFPGQGPMVERLGRYIRIQLAGDGELAVGDVSVIGYRHEGPVLFLIQAYARVRTNDVFVDGRQDRLVIRGTVSNATWQIERRADLTSPWALIAEVRATNSIQRWNSQPYIPDPAGFFRTREKLISLP
jgi:hypothetical protein